jgi:hypothetical protein
MSFPGFNERGDLPEGIYPASFEELIARFGKASPTRQEVTTRLQRIWDMAFATRELDRLLIFGSYVSDTPSPMDVDVILVMQDDFRPEECDKELRVLFDHRRAQQELGASVFWIRPGMLLGEPLEAFLAHWQIKRDGNRRGIVEVKP